MSVIYISKPGTNIRKRGGRIHIIQQGEMTAAVPIHEVERIVLLGPSEISAGAARSLLRAGAPVLYCSQRGMLYGTLTSSKQNIERLLIQIETWKNQSIRQATARNIVERKCNYQRNILMRQARNHGDEELRNAADQIRITVSSLERRNTLDAIRGVEGYAAAIYFSAFGRCLRKQEFEFKGRNRRPPRDPVNALLSLGYMLLLGEASIALEAQGLHSGLGFLHEMSGRRPALALDLLELFRQPIIDRLVLSAINRGVVQSCDFEDKGEKVGVRLRPKALKNYLALFERSMTAKFQDKHNANDAETTYRDLVKKEASEVRRSIENQTVWVPQTVEI